MNFDGLNFEDEKASGRPPVQPNASLWSKSSTGSGHTEHEEDSQYRLDRLEYLNSLNDNARKFSPSVHNSEGEGISGYGSGGHLSDLSHPYEMQRNDAVFGGSNRSTPTSYQDRGSHQRMRAGVLPSHQNHSNNPSPRNLLHNPYAPPANTPTSNTARSPYAYEYDGVDFTSHTEGRNMRTNIPHYSPSAAISAAAWRPSVTSATSSSIQLRGTPTHASSKPPQHYSIPPMSPGVAGSYQTQYAAAHGGGVNGLIYQVQFKCAVKNYILGAQAHPSIMIGDFVVVEADRGEDIGVVLEILPMKTFVERRIYMKNAADDDNVIGRIIRLASVTERQFLPEKFHDEENVVQFCRELAYTTYRLPMMIHDVEYQFDRHKLTIYYSSDARVDFREFVRDLFSAYKARIWMKKVAMGKPLRSDNWASVALATGMQFSPDAK